MRYFKISAIIVIFSILGGLIFLSSQTTSDIKNEYQPSFDQISSQKDTITRALSQTSILMDRISDYHFENFEFYSRVLVSHVQAAKDINIKPFKSLLSGKDSIYILDELEAALLEYKQASEDVIHEYRKLNENTNEKISEQKLNTFITCLRKLVRMSTRYDVALMHIEGHFSKKIKDELGKTLDFILYALITLSTILFLILLFINKNYKERKQSLEKIQKSESKLREREELFRAVFEQAGGYCMILKPTDSGIPEILDANEAAFKTHGYTREEMIGRPVADLDDEDGKKQCRKNTDIILSGQTLAIERCHVRKDGTAFPVEVYANRIDFEDKPSLIVTTEFDITEKKQKQMLQESQIRLLKYASTHSSSEVLTKFIDEAEALTRSKMGFYHLYNETDKRISLCRWSTNTVQKMCKAKGMDAHYPIEKAGVWADCTLERKPVIHNDYNGLTNKKGLPEGHTPVIRELVVPVIKNDMIVAILGVGNKEENYHEADVSVVQELADFAWEVVGRLQAEELLYKNERMLRKIGDNYPNSYISIIEKDFTIGLTMGQEFKKSKLNPDHFVGMSIDDVFGDNSEMLKKHYSEAFKGNEQSFELFLNNQYQHYRCVPLVENGSIDRLLVVVENITERKSLEQKLQQSQKMESVGNLAGGIAHDFNNILFPIIGMSELLMEDLKPDSLEYENAQEIYKAGNRAKDLVTQILSFSRQADHEMMPVKLQKVIKEVLKLCRATIPTNIDIKQNIQQDCGSLWANSTQLHQIGMNLVTNAFHAVQDKNGKIYVDLKEINLEKNDASTLSMDPGKYVLLSVSDNGPGISEDIKRKIFEPYFTTKDKGKGTGLGLAVVYGIVKDFGGNIQVHSEQGSGTTFNVYLPLIKNDQNVKPDALTTANPTGDENILLVDDEPQIARLLKLSLERIGYEITVCTSSIEALEAFKKNPDKFDMIISDMSMPNMTGDQLAHEIRQIKQDIPIIICTGFSERINKERAEKIGISGFLMKPIAKTDMAKMVRRVLDEAKKSNGF